MSGERETPPKPASGHVHRRLGDATGRCYLTFDDGPDAQWTPRVLESLAVAGVHASFFVIGRLVPAAAALLREAHAAGHTIGNHSFSHAHPWTVSRNRARSELRDGADAIAQALGTRPEWFRPPHGRLGLHMAAVAREEGQQIALWSLSAVDWGPLASPHRMIDRLRVVRAGDIVLMHDGPLRHNRPDHTVRILPALLSLLASHGPMPAALPPVATMRE